ncbi:MAG: ROK family protein [Deltaproteobacteria bacterium]|nr:ROK family protein [Deltaproteobacteria bacterium]MBW2419849.1 ROK family protein [Deltaproteobacteria bacterium]
MDFGGTRIKVAVVEGAVIERSADLETQSGAGPGEILDAIADQVRALAPGPEAVGLAIPGEVDSSGKIWRLPNVPGFAGVAMARELRERLGCPIVVENDGTAAALAEALFGHGREHPSFMMLTLGTGIGGGLVLDGNPHRGAHGFAAEVGHVSIERGAIEPGADPWQCGCGRYGCMEAYAGTAGLLRRFAELGGQANEIREIAESARRGEDAGRLVFEGMGEALGLGITTMQNLLDLDAFVFTGGVSRSFDLIEPALRRTLRDHGFAQILSEVPLLLSGLEDRAGVIGAAHLPGRFA